MIQASVAAAPKSVQPVLGLAHLQLSVLVELLMSGEPQNFHQLLDESSGSIVFVKCAFRRWSCLFWSFPFQIFWIILLQHTGKSLGTMKCSKNVLSSVAQSCPTLCDPMLMTNGEPRSHVLGGSSEKDQKRGLSWPWRREKWPQEVVTADEFS